MFGVFLLFFTGLLSGGYLYWQNSKQDKVDVRIYDRYAFQLEDSSSSSTPTIGIGTVPIANMDGGVIPYLAVQVGTSCPSGYTYNSASGMCEQQTTMHLGSYCGRPNEYPYRNPYSGEIRKCVSYTVATCPPGWWPANAEECVTYATGTLCPSAPGYVYRITNTCYTRKVCPPGYDIDLSYNPTGCSRFPDAILEPVTLQATPEKRSSKIRMQVR
jgi:hypothetical protein